MVGVMSRVRRLDALRRLDADHSATNCTDIDYFSLYSRVLGTG